MSADSKDGATSAGAGTGASTPHKHKAETGNDRAGNVNSIGGIRLLLSDGNGGPAKKKRKTRQHVQPDDLIHPTVHSYGLPDDYLHHAAAASAMTASNATANNNTDASANAAAMDITVPSQPAITAISPSSSSTDGAAEPASSPAALLRSPAFTRSSSPLPRTGSTSHLTVSVDPNAAQSAAASPSGKADKPKKQTKKQKEQQQKQLRKEKAAAKAAAAAATMQQPSSTATTAATATTSSSSTQSSTASTSSSSSTTTATDKKGFRAQDKAKAAAEGAELQAKKKTSGLDAKLIKGDTFEQENHFYPRVLNSNIHPMVANFFRLGNDRIAARYCHLNPKVKEDNLKKLLADCPKVFRWSGCDLFNVTNVNGVRQMIIVETNSCPSGQKSMPLISEEELSDGYHKLMRTTFLPTVAEMERKGELPKGGLAVIYDKNPMEASGYAAAMAALSKEPVMLAEFYETDTDPPVKWVDGVVHIRDEEKKWHPMRACFRYVTQRPWNRIPMESKTLIFNPVAACLAGGRNKMAADKAYELYNHMIAQYGLKIRTPETIRDVAKEMVPLWVASMGGHAVVKVPYSNAGQGVYTIVNEEELKAFMESPQRYDKYIVQSLVGNSTWSSITRAGQYFHAGTIPNKKQETFAADLRVMVSGGPQTGFTPVAVYARRAEKPLATKLDHAEDSWAMLGTNLSVKLADGGWSTETERLLLMDMKDFNRLGIGTDDLIDAYVQTVLATTAIDKLAIQLVKNCKFDFMLYRSLNSDESLLREIMLGQRHAASSNPQTPILMPTQTAGSAGHTYPYPYPLPPSAATALPFGGLNAPLSLNKSNPSAAAASSSSSTTAASTSSSQNK